MRFKLFGFKGNISILEANKNKNKKKKAPKDDDSNTITCIGYRTTTEFDRPPIPPVRYNSNQPSSSSATHNGDIPYTTVKRTRGIAPTPFAKVTNGHISNSKLKDTRNAVSASQPELRIRPHTPSSARRPKAIAVTSPTVPQAIPADKKTEEVTNYATTTAASAGLAGAQSLPDLSNTEKSVRFKYDDDDDDEYKSDVEIHPNNGALTIVTGQTTRAKQVTYDDDDDYSDDDDVNNQVGDGSLTVVTGQTTRTKYTADDDDYDEDEDLNNQAAYGASTAVTGQTSRIKNQADNGSLTVVAGQTTRTKFTEVDDEIDYDDEDGTESEDGDGTFTMVPGQTTRTTHAANDNEKKSTLIFMTEDHDNRDSDEYDDDYEDDYGRGSNYRENAANGYSNQATSIFFNDSVPEPQQRMRTFKYRDDDDNGSQTSA